jgi:hypothetical protein
MGDTQKCGSQRRSSCAMAKHAAMVIIRGGAQKFLLACQLKRLLRIRRKNANGLQKPVLNDDW